MININLQGSTPLYEQVYKQIVELVMKNVMKPHDQIPSVRALAKELGINPNTISKAYTQLENDHIIYSLAGRGSFIAEFDTGIVKQKAFGNFENAVSDALNVGILKDELIELINIR